MNFTNCPPLYLELHSKPLWWQRLNLQQSAYGYGKKLTTTRVAYLGGRLHRVYTAIFSNAGTSYIIKGGMKFIISDVC